MNTPVHQSYINKGAMLSLKNMFKGVKSLLNKYNSAKKKDTKDKYYEEIKTKLDTQNINRVFKEDLVRQKQEEKQRKKQRKELQKKLNAALKQQKKLNKERAKQNAKLEKMKKQQTLSNRLLSNNERDLLIWRKKTQALDQEELNLTKNLRMTRRNEFVEKGMPINTVGILRKAREIK